MPLDWTPGGDVSQGGSWASEPGTYHLGITNVQDPAVDNKGAIVPNAAFRIECEIMAGTVASQVGKTIDILFFLPKPSDKNEGAFAKKKIDRFLVAACLATQEQIESKTPLKLDPTKANGHQIIARFDKEGDAKYLSLAFSDIYHVDDPAVKDIPKSADALALIQPSLRRIGSQPAPSKATKATTASNGAAKSPTPAPEPVQAASNQEVAAGWDDV